MALILESSSFDDGDPIPRVHAAIGDNVSPPLRWRGEPDGTKSFALVVEDPDAPDPRSPTRIFTHWVVYDLPPAAHELATGASRAGLPSGAAQGVNDFGDAGWDGPKPPIGRHRYFFRLWALDARLPEKRFRRDELLRAIEGHVLDYGELVGTFDAPGARRSS